MNENIEQQRKLTLEELLALDGFIDIDPNEIFGVNFDDGFDSLPPLAQSYAGIGSALGGNPIDSWGRLGMHRNRAEKFSSFDALTKDLSVEDKVRAVVILRQYLNDISKRMPDFRNKPFESQTLLSAQAWVMDMLASVDQATHEACAQAQIPGFEAAGVAESDGEIGTEKETAEAATPSTLQTVMSATQRAQENWFQRLFRRGE